jgi:hypothetical protein
MWQQGKPWRVAGPEASGGHLRPSLGESVAREDRPSELLRGGAQIFIQESPAYNQGTEG